RAYALQGTPGTRPRRPPPIAPYHLRLDWLMWFAAISPGYADGWFVPLLHRLRDGDESPLKLLRHNPFPDSPPIAIRARFYRYRFTTRAERKATGEWWHRTFIGDFA